jgi:hypothetical protein
MSYLKLYDKQFTQRSVTVKVDLKRVHMYYPSTGCLNVAAWCRRSD